MYCDQDVLLEDEREDRCVLVGREQKLHDESFKGEEID